MNIVIPIQKGKGNISINYKLFIWCKIKFLNGHGQIFHLKACILKNHPLQNTCDYLAMRLARFCRTELYANEVFFWKRSAENLKYECRIYDTDESDKALFVFFWINNCERDKFKKKVKKWVRNCKILLYLLISFVLFRQSVLSIVKVNATTEKALAIIILFRPTKKWFERMNYLSWLVSRNVVPQKCKKKLNNLQRDPFLPFTLLNSAWELMF